MLSFFCLGLLVTYVTAAHKPCCFSSVFEADVMEAGAEIIAGVPNAIDREVKLYYDYNQMLMRADLVQQGMPVQTYMNYKMHKRYIVFNNTCTKENMNEILPSPCIPDNATFVRYFAAGSATHNVNIQAWEMPDTTGGYTRIGVTNDCVPVVQMILDMKSTTEPRQVNYIFTNVEPQIHNATVFDLPKICH